MNKASSIADYYAELEQQLFYILVDVFKQTRPQLLKADDDPKSIIKWRLEALDKIGGLTEQVVKLISKNIGIPEKQLKELIESDGLTVANQFNSELSTMLKKPPIKVSASERAIIKSYASQTFVGVHNYVNQTLLTTNYGSNSAAKTYQKIIDKTVLNVIVGKQKASDALNSNIYQWRDTGMKSGLIDKGGHEWSLEGYTRTVINSTTSRVYNDLKIQSMKDFNSVLCVMSSHVAARPACAPIQGKIVCIVPHNDPRCDENYPNIYDYGYGTPAGTQGINCGHALYPYIKGISHNYQPQYDPVEAVEKMKVLQKQRYLERGVRNAKRKLELAKRLGDKNAINRYNASVRGYQAKLRQIVKEHDYLARQYSREQIVK